MAGSAPWVRNPAPWCGPHCGASSPQSNVPWGHSRHHSLVSCQPPSGDCGDGPRGASKDALALHAKQDHPPPSLAQYTYAEVRGGCLPGASVIFCENLGRDGWSPRARGTQWRLELTFQIAGPTSMVVDSFFKAVRRPPRTLRPEGFAAGLVPDGMHFGRAGFLG